MKITYLSKLAAISFMSMGVMVGCANPCAAKQAPVDTPAEADMADPCAAKEDPCAAKKDPCAAKDVDPCAAKEDPCAGS